jgi:hypothetical protein
MDHFALVNPVISASLPEIVGMKLDYAKRPFKVVNVGLMLEQFRALLRIER